MNIYYAETQMELLDCFREYSDIEKVQVRVKENLAQKCFLENWYIIIGGRVYYFQISGPIIGIYVIMLQDKYGLTIYCQE